MGENTKISWAQDSWNPWLGCQKVGEGCTNCYAESWAKRSGLVKWGPGAPRRRTSEANWRKPLKWDREAKQSGEPRRVFCASLADVFDNMVPAVWRSDLFSLIRETPHLTWLLLTKRIGNWKMCLPFDWGEEGYANVCLMVTVVNQEEADRDIPKLLEIPARWRAISYEPALGPVDFRPWLAGWWHCGGCGCWCPGAQLGEEDPINGFRCPTCRRFDITTISPSLDWIIVGGESGPNARPFHVNWARAVIGQCFDAGATCHVKQLGRRPYFDRDETAIYLRDPAGRDWSEWPEDLRVREALPV